jgi:hypothetical protein
MLSYALFTLCGGVLLFGEEVTIGSPISSQVNEDVLSVSESKRFDDSLMLKAVQIEGEGKLSLIVASLYRQPNRNIEHMHTLCRDIHNPYEKFKSSTINFLSSNGRS